MPIDPPCLRAMLSSSKGWCSHSNTAVYTSQHTCARHPHTCGHSSLIHGEGIAFTIRAWIALLYRSHAATIKTPDAHTRASQVSKWQFCKRLSSTLANFCRLPWAQQLFNQWKRKNNIIDSHACGKAAQQLNKINDVDSMASIKGKPLSCGHAEAHVRTRGHTNSFVGCIVPMKDAAAQVCSAALLERMRKVKASSNMWCCLWTALTPYKSFGPLPSWNLVPFLGHDRDVSLSTNLRAVVVEVMPIAERSINSSQNDDFGACIHGAGRRICLWNHPAMRLQRMVAWFIVEQGIRATCDLYCSIVMPVTFLDFFVRIHLDSFCLRVIIR